MKKMFFIVGATFLSISSSAFALDDEGCKTIPSCASLGYTDTVSHCPQNVNGKDSVIKCPFDLTQGKCIFEASIGQIAYFSQQPDANSGWLLCDGSSKSRTKYPDLAKFLDTQFCSNTYHFTSTCASSSGIFAVPDYRGYFLRVQAPYTSSVNSNFSSLGGSVNISLTSPQKEQLPNLQGVFGLNGSSLGDGDVNGNTKGLFKHTTDSRKLDQVAKGGAGNNAMNFSAKRHNNIYKDNGHVIPGNYAVYTYIYAGRVVNQ